MLCKIACFIVTLIQLPLLFCNLFLLLFISITSNLRLYVLLPYFFMYTSIANCEVVVLAQRFQVQVRDVNLTVQTGDVNLTVQTYT